MSEVEWMVIRKDSSSAHSQQTKEMTEEIRCSDLIHQHRTRAVHCSTITSERVCASTFFTGKSFRGQRKTKLNLQGFGAKSAEGAELNTNRDSLIIRTHV